MEGLSASDVALISGGMNDNGRGGFMGDDMWAFLIFALIFGWGGNGWGGFGGGGNRGGFGTMALATDLNGIATRSDISEAFALNGLNNGIDNLASGQTAIQQALCNGFAGVNTNLMQLGFNLQDCCCQTQRSIDGVNYNMAKNTCDITNAIKDSTQTIVNLFTQEKIASLQTELQSAQLALQNNAQTRTIIEALSTPAPKPAYITASPYQSAFMFNPYGFGGWNNSCNPCSCGC